MPVDFTPEPAAPTKAPIDFQPIDFEPETPGAIKGIANSFRRGNLAGQRAIEAIQFTPETGPSFRQGRRAFESAMEDPEYLARLTAAGDDPAALARVESLFGPGRRLEPILDRTRQSNIATAENVAGLSREMQGIAQSEAMQEWSKANNSNWWQVFAKNPVEITANIFAESIPQAAGAMTAGMAGGAAGGPAGAAVGAGTGSFAVEAANALLEAAAQNGVDLTDADQVRAFFSDETKVKAAREFAAKRGFPIAMMDALTAGVAGKFLKPAIGQGMAKVAGATALEAGTQMAGGAAGEAAAQVISGQPLSMRDIAGEAIGELVTAPGEVFTNLREEKARIDFQPMAEPAAKPPPKAEPAEVSADALKDLQAAMRGEAPESTRLKGATPEALDVVLADLPQTARDQIQRRLDAPEPTPEPLPPVQRYSERPPELTEEQRAAIEFQRRTDEAVAEQIANPDKNYEGMTAEELKLLAGLGDARAIAEQRRKERQAKRENAAMPQPVIFPDPDASQAIDFVPSSEPPATAETITGRPSESAADEQTGSGIPAEALQPVPPSLAAPPSKPKRRSLPTDRPPDIIDLIEAEVGKIDPALIREADPYWKPVGAARRLFKRGGIAADSAINGLTYSGPQLGLQQDTKAGEFGQMINAAANARQAEKSKAAEYKRRMDAEAREVETRRQFENKVLQGERPKSAPRDAVAVPVDGLVVGDRFKVQDWNFEVQDIEFDPDDDGRVTSVTLKDGPKFGVQTVEGRDVIHIDEGTLRKNRKARAEAEPADFAPSEAEGSKMARAISHHKGPFYAVSVDAVGRRGAPDKAKTVAELEEKKTIAQRLGRSEFFVYVGKPSENLVGYYEKLPPKEGEQSAKPLPTIKSGQNQGDLLGSGDVDFNLYGERTGDGDRAAADKRQREETEREAKAFEKKNQTDIFEQSLDKLKIETPPGSLQAFGLLPEMWNGLIEAVRLAYRGGKSIAAAIEDGLAWLKTTHGAQQFDEQAVRKELEQALRDDAPAGSAGPRPTDAAGLDAQLEDLQQRLERLEMMIIRTRRTGKAERVRSLLDERERLQAEFNRLRYGAEQAAEAVEQKPAAPIEEFTQAQLDKVSSATMDGAPNAESFWSRFKRGLRYFATNTPEIALRGDEATNAARFRRGVRLFGVESENAKRTAARDINRVLEPMKALGRDVTNPNAVAKFFDLGKKIRREEARANPREERLEKLRQLQAETRQGLERNPWYLFQQAVLWRDLWYRRNFLKTPSGGDITLPGGLELDQVERAMQQNERLIADSPHAVAIRESLQRHYRLMADLQESLLQHGELIPDELRNPLYFPHHLLEKFTGQLDRARPTTEKDFRGYLIAPVGSEKLIEAGYLNALYKHVNDVTAHNARADVVEKYWRPYDQASARQAELEAEASANDTTAHPDAWKRNIPPGLELFTPSEEIPMRADYILNRGELAKQLGVTLPANGDLRSQLQQLGADVRLTGDMITKALVAGERPQWLLPTEIAEAIRGVVKREDAKSADTVGKRIGNWLRKPIQAWKANTLFNWYNYPRYEWGNTVTDIIDKMLGADPGMARYLGRSLREVRDAAKGDRTPEFEAAEREGVLQTVTAREVEDLAKLPEFEEFLTSKQWKLQKVRKFITWTARASQLRESTFRYAKFLADLERIRRGEQPVYAGAYWRDVQAAPTPEAKAAEITLKTFGDYSNLSVVGEFLRQHVFPFWSWQEINLKYHANLFRNLYDMLALPIGERPRGAGAAARAAAVSSASFTARAAVGIALRLAVMRLAVEAWNQFGGAWAGLWDPEDDLEGQLSEADRRRFHLLLGKDDQGRARVVYIPNALSDVAEWFGGNNFARLFTEWAKGDIGIGQFAGDFAKQLPTDFLNKVGQGVRPDAKFAYMAVSGKDPFPDVTAQRDISRENMGWLLMQTVTDRDAATFLRQQLDRDYYSPEDVGDWLSRKILQVRRRDPDQWAYFEVRDRAADWKEQRTGKRNDGFDYRSPDQQVIRNFRKAVYRADMENAIRFYNRLQDFGYTSQRFAQSIRNQNPLSDLNVKERREFVQGLTEYERGMLGRAMRHYAKLTSGAGRVPLFPAVSRPGVRRPSDRLERAIENRQQMDESAIDDTGERLLRQSLR